jgi:hypothetical protein
LFFLKLEGDALGFVVGGSLSNLKLDCPLEVRVFEHKNNSTREEKSILVAKNALLSANLLTID